MKKKILFALSFIVLFSNVVPAESSKDLLAKALRLSNSINNNLTVERRLSIYEEIQNVVDKIILEYSGTDEGIKLLSGQTVGSFNYSSIQSNYVEELTSYYDTVCKVSPSFDCIAFVSLDQGVKSCRNSNNFDSLDSAHKEIINALNIFTSQNSKEQYRSLALNSYRNCLSSSKIANDQVIQDYFSSNLVSLFISLGMQEQARAMIQQMEDPFSKFAGVIELYKVGDKMMSRDYIERMSKFVNTSGMGTGNRQLAEYKLKTEMLLQNDFPINLSDLKYNSYEGLNGKNTVKRPIAFGVIENQCTAVFNNKLFNAVINLWNISLIRLNEIKPDRLGYELNEMLRSNGMDKLKIYEFMNSCARQTDKRNYAKALDIYSRISAFDYEEGNKFLDYTLKTNYNYTEMMEYYFDLEQERPTIIPFVGFIEGAWNPDNKHISNIYNQYYVFKKRISYNQMCEAIDMLFKEFKSTSNYNLAIAYLIDSPDVDRNKKYNCGDAELELLLN